MAAPRTTESPNPDHSFESRSAKSGSGAGEGGAFSEETKNHDDKPSGAYRRLRTSSAAAPDVETPRDALTPRDAMASITPESVAPESIASGVDAPDGTSLRKSWEIVEEFDHEGHRYRLQRRRISTPKSSPLARREEETLELASEGMNRKQIAKRLGLAPSTVGVLLHRASIKLRARSRNELLSSYRELTEKSRAGQ